MAVRVALVGNPNSGKTTLFNTLTGSSQQIGNWPGVTVEKKEAKLKGTINTEIIDLPGIYSLSAYTPEEMISRNFFLQDNPDIILNILDGTNLERNLYLTTQLIETSIPVILVINMIDIVKKNGDEINIKSLSSTFNCKVIAISAIETKHSFYTIKKTIESVRCTKQNNIYPIYSDFIEISLSKIAKLIQSKKIVSNKILRWYSIKTFENDLNTLSLLNLNSDELVQIKKIQALAEKKYEDSTEAILINERYNYITNLVPYFYKKNDKLEIIDNKIDAIITNKFLSIPIFISVITFIYYISIKVVGAPISQFIDKYFFGDILKTNVENVLNMFNVDSWLVDLVVNGIISGVGSVLAFIPQIFIMFLLLFVLEDCGYMSRVAFITDKLLYKFGLSGKSVISFLISSGCGVPGILSTRTMENKKERLITIMTTTFIPCSAKLPLIALVCSSTILKEYWFIAPTIYFSCILMVLIVGNVLSKIYKKNNQHYKSIMEIPKYHIPKLKCAIIHAYTQIKFFAIKAGTIILITSILAWCMSNLNLTTNGIEFTNNQNSILAKLGQFISPIFKPLGFGNWRAVVCSISGLIAKENIINTLAVITDNKSENTQILNLMCITSNNVVAAISFLLFNLICAPCCAAIAAIYKETKSMKLTTAIVTFQTAIAYCTSLIFFQVITFLLNNSKIYDFISHKTNIILAFFFILSAIFCYMCLKKFKIHIIYRAHKQ